MIEILPMTDQKEEANLRQKEGIANKEVRILCMTDGSERMGYIIVRLEEKEICFCCIRAIDYTFIDPPNAEQSFILDSLLRAGASFGEVNGANEILTEFPDFYGFFLKRGFKEGDHGMQGPMDLIVKYS